MLDRDEVTSMDRLKAQWTVRKVTSRKLFGDHVGEVWTRGSRVVSDRCSTWDGLPSREPTYPTKWKRKLIFPTTLGWDMPPNPNGNFPSPIRCGWFQAWLQCLMVHCWWPSFGPPWQSFWSIVVLYKRPYGLLSLVFYQALGWFINQKQTSLSRNLAWKKHVPPPFRTIILGGIQIKSPGVYSIGTTKV